MWWYERYIDLLDDTEDINLLLDDTEDIDLLLNDFRTALKRNI